MLVVQKKYHDHRIHAFTLNELIKYLTFNTITKDRAYMRDQLIPHLEFFKSRGISELPDITQMLHDIGFKATDKLLLITSFRDFMNHKNIEIPLVKARQLRQANDGEKNILICKELSEYPNDFLEFMKNYIQKYPKILQPEKFLQELEIKAQQLNPEFASFEDGNEKIKSYVDEMETYQTNTWESLDLNDSDQNDSYFEEITF